MLQKFLLGLQFEPLGCRGGELDGVVPTPVSARIDNLLPCGPGYLQRLMGRGQQQSTGRRRQLIIALQSLGQQPLRDHQRLDDIAGDEGHLVEQTQVVGLGGGHPQLPLLQADRYQSVFDRHPRGQQGQHLRRQLQQLLAPQARSAEGPAQSGHQILFQQKTLLQQMDPELASENLLALQRLDELRRGDQSQLQQKLSQPSGGFQWLRIRLGPGPIRIDKPSRAGNAVMMLEGAQQQDFRNDEGIDHPSGDEGQLVQLPQVLHPGGRQAEALPLGGEGEDQVFFRHLALDQVEYGGGNLLQFLPRDTGNLQQLAQGQGQPVLAEHPEAHQVGSEAAAENTLLLQRPPQILPGQIAIANQKFPTPCRHSLPFLQPGAATAGSSYWAATRFGSIQSLPSRHLRVSSPSSASWSSRVIPCR